MTGWKLNDQEAVMATADQIKSLIRSHVSDEPERFYTIALQVAAHEARQGHSSLAHEIRELIDASRKNRKAAANRLPREIQGLVLSETSEVSKASLVIPSSLSERIDRAILEFRQRAKLKSHGLIHRRKMLLIGPPGTGKTMTARVLAHELHLPLYTIQVDRLVTKFMGETAAKLRQIFDLIQREVGVYLFDEFDAIGGERSSENDVGEMRRVLNSFLQFIEQEPSDSVIVAATNTPKLLDRALFRRFDDVLYYEHPSEEERKQLMGNVLGTFLPPRFSWKNALSESKDLSQAEIDQACTDAIKHAILSDSNVIGDELIFALRDRQEAHRGFQG